MGRVMPVFAGDLTEFALSAVLRVLSDNAKTGLLEVVTDDRPGGVEFVDGGIRAATVDRRRTGLARRLLGMGRLNATTLLEVLEADGPLGGDARLAELLVRGAHLPAGEVAAVLRDHTIDGVLQLTRATAGSFRFRADDAAERTTAELTLSAAEVLEEAGRRQQVIAALSSAHLRPMSVLRVVAGAGEVPVTISTSAWRLLALLDGKRTVADLLDITGGAMEDTYQQLAELLDAGITTTDAATTTQAMLDDHQRLTALERAWGIDVRTDDAAPSPVGPRAATEVAVAVAPAPGVTERTATITSLSSRDRQRRAQAGPAFDEVTLRRFVAGVEALA
jgi:hypothetical protein